MAANPVVSVVLPVRNRAAVLPRALASVRGQTVCDLEILVVDDASTDGTAGVAEAAGDSRIRLLRHDRRRGAAAARNTGAEAARGTYIAFLDSDDEWLPGKLQSQLALFAGDAGLAAACARHFVTLGPMAPSWQRYLPGRTDWVRYLVDRGCDLSPGSTLIVRRDVFEAVGPFDESLPRYEDWDWLLRLVTAGHALAVDLAPNAIVHLSDVPAAADIERAVALFRERWDGLARRLGPMVTRRYLARFELELAKALLREGKRRRAVGRVCAGLMRWPFQRPGSAIRLFGYLTGLRDVRHAPTGTPESLPVHK